MRILRFVHERDQMKVRAALESVADALASLEAIDKRSYRTSWMVPTKQRFYAAENHLKQARDMLRTRR